MTITPKVRRNIKRILPFGAIWFLMGSIFIYVEVAAMGTPTPDSPTIIDLTLPVFLFASMAGILVGFLVGALEILFMERLFRRSTFLWKVIGKFILYTFLMFVIISVTFPIAASFELGLNLFDPAVWTKFKLYLVSETLTSTLVQMGTSLLLCLLYAAISENLGHGVMLNFISGKYHRPQREDRIFMFLDLAASTTIAEKLGNKKYFQFLKTFYQTLSDGIVNHLGEVYQYIGDEVVITWKIRDGLWKANCLRAFFSMKETINNRQEYFQQQFGVTPQFRAGVHLGSVTTGEIGALKKEIFFTGDVLNVSARIQALTKKYGSELIISADLNQALPDKSHFKSHSLGIVELKGRHEPIEIFEVAQGSLSE